MTVALETTPPILKKPGVTEPLAYSTQQQGASAGSACHTILVGLDTGDFYCAEDGCTYTAPKWTSVFAHRSSCNRTAKGNTLRLIAGGDPTAALQTLMAENFELRARLEVEKSRRTDAERIVLRVRRAVS